MFDHFAPLRGADFFLATGAPAQTSTTRGKTHFVQFGSVQHSKNSSIVLAVALATVPHHAATMPHQCRCIKGFKAPPPHPTLLVDGCEGVDDRRMSLARRRHTDIHAHTHSGTEPLAAYPYASIATCNTLLAAASRKRDAVGATIQCYPTRPTSVFSLVLAHSPTPTQVALATMLLPWLCRSVIVPDVRTPINSINIYIQRLGSSQSRLVQDSTD